MGIEKHYYGYKINDFYCDKHTPQWNHAEDRIRSFQIKCKDDEEFKKKMVTRLKRIKNEEKIYYTIAVLIEYGYHDVAEIYDSQLVMNQLIGEIDFDSI
jgi:hypothetical protein